MIISSIPATVKHILEHNDEIYCATLMGIVISLDLSGNTGNEQFHLSFCVLLMNTNGFLYLTI